MKFFNNLNKKEKKHLREIYRSSFKERARFSDEKKAKAYAKAKLFEEAFKIFLQKENNISILETWKKKEIPNTYIKESIDFKTYKIGNKKLITSTDEKILERFPEAERKGMFRNMKDEYEQEIFFKAKEKHGISLHPDMYYVIK